MKKFCFLLLTCFLLIHQNSFAQLNSFGYKFGLNTSNAEKEGASDFESRNGLIGGFYYEYKTPFWIIIQPELLYAQGGYRFDDTKINRDYVELPIFIKARLPFIDFLIGPAFGVNIQSTVYEKKQLWTDEWNEDIKHGEFCLKMGVANHFALFSRNFSIEARYSLGLSNVKNAGEEFNRSVSLMLSMGTIGDGALDEISRLKRNVLTELRPILTAAQIKRLKKLKTQDDVNIFVETLWQNVDPTPDTAENEYKDEYYQRIAFVDSAFHQLKRGCETDRGRVFLKYGKPDEIVRENFPNMNPLILNDGSVLRSFEIWLYHKGPGSDAYRNHIFENIYPGMMRFVFADLHGIGVYEQIFSTEVGEVINSKIFILER